MDYSNAIELWELIKKEDQEGLDSYEDKRKFDLEYGVAAEMLYEAAYSQENTEDPEDLYNYVMESSGWDTRDWDWSNILNYTIDPDISGVEEVFLSIETQEDLEKYIDTCLEMTTDWMEGEVRRYEMQLDLPEKQKSKGRGM